MLVWQLEPNQRHPCLVISFPITFNPHQEDSTLVVLEVQFKNQGFQNTLLSNTDKFQLGGTLMN